MTQTITILRYSSAKTKAELLAEIANADSKDHGVGGGYQGLCVGLEAGDIDVTSLIPAIVSDNCKKHNCHLDYRDTPSGLAATIHTGSNLAVRTMWRMTVDASEIVGLADRYIPGMVPMYYVDGLILRRGAKVANVRKVGL